MNSQLRIRRTDDDHEDSSPSSNDSRQKLNDHKDSPPSSNDSRQKLIHSRPVHTAIHPSLFSKESHAQNFRGFINLALLLLFANLMRLAMENWMRYGLLLTVPFMPLAPSNWAYLSLILLFLIGSLALAWLSEQIAAKRLNCTIALAVSNLTGILLIPPYIIWRHVYHPGLGMVALGMALVLGMKLISYHAVNYEMRKSKQLQANQNLSFGNLVYFWLAPTLCYQPTYPQIPQIRWGFLGKRCLEFASASAMI